VLKDSTTKAAALIIVSVCSQGEISSEVSENRAKIELS